MKLKTEVVAIVIVLILQTIIYILVGVDKSYLHIDEAYSFGLTHYERVEIEDTEDFYNSWHTNHYYENYLFIQEDESLTFAPVYENQKNDVHPPLYYLLLRIAMSFTKNHFSKWPGIILNIIIYGFITIFMYLLLKKILQGEKHFKKKAIILAFMSSIILASLSNVIYIRMYSLLTLEILITTFLHVKLIENQDSNGKLLLCIGICVLAGILTHYYYLFYLVALSLIFFIKYIKQKNKKALLCYFFTIITSGVISLIIWPYSLQHMFFGYRGQGVIDNLKNIYDIIPSILSQLHTLNYYVFNNLMYFIIASMLVLFVYIKLFKKSNAIFHHKTREILNVVFIPSLFFFIITSIASPWKILRYVVPVCGLLFVLVIYCFYKMLQTLFSQKTTNILILILFCTILVTPFIFHMKPEFAYTEKKDIVHKLENDLNLPTVYLYNSKTGGFLHDIFLFSIIDESYIAKDIEYTEENIQKIFAHKDISRGIIVFINDGQDKDSIIRIVQKALNLTNLQHLERIWSGEIYFISKL